MIDQHMDHRLFYPATSRNRTYIRDILQDVLPAHGEVLEIASGSGEHITYFAQQFPTLYWTPTDIEEEALDSIRAWQTYLGLTTLRSPRFLDITQPSLDLGKFDALLCINMIHISPWAATLGVLSLAEQHLKTGGLLYLYGPYRQKTVKTAASNEAFDRRLKEMNPDFGLRSLEDICALAEQKNLRLERVLDMPANNLSVIFNRI